MGLTQLPPSVQLKIDLMFEGVRYSEALGRAAEHAFPNFYPYRFQPGEPDPTGSGKAVIPYMMNLADGTTVRVKGNGASAIHVASPSPGQYQLVNDATVDPGVPVSFEPLPSWMGRLTRDGFQMAQAGVSLHGDMAVVNVAPGCDYFLADKRDGQSMRCTFCAYGAPDGRSTQLGQVAGVSAIPEPTLVRLQETLRAALAETAVRHIYLVGGSMTDWREEGARFLELARRVRAVVGEAVPVTCGSGALPEDYLRQLQGEALVNNICFNLEVWSEELFARVCPGKHRFVGYHRWIESLETAVSLFGPERVYTAMVAGVELEPEYGFTWESAAQLALEGADDLLSRGIIPIYSLYWPLGGRDHPDYMPRLRAYFERLNLGYRALRERNGLRIWDGFMCHRCAYMQLECDIDRLAPVGPRTS